MHNYMHMFRYSYVYMLLDISVDIVNGFVSRKDIVRAESVGDTRLVGSEYVLSSQQGLRMN